MASIALTDDQIFFEIDEVVSQLEEKGVPMNLILDIMTAYIAVANELEPTV